MAPSGVFVVRFLEEQSLVPRERALSASYPSPSPSHLGLFFVLFMHRRSVAMIIFNTFRAARKWLGTNFKRVKSLYGSGCHKPILQLDLARTDGTIGAFVDLLNYGQFPHLARCFFLVH